MKKTTREWVRKAEADYVIARQCSRGKIPLHDGVCFHCQQCAEKYLKEYEDLCTVDLEGAANDAERLERQGESRRRRADFLCLVAKGKEA